MRTKMMMMAMMFVVLTASFAVAADDQNVDIGIDNRITVSATGGAANSNQNQGQDQNQDQNQHQNQTSTSTSTSGAKSDASNGNQTFTNQTPRNHITAMPGMVGAIAPIAAIAADGKWHVRLCEEFTVEELENMKDSSSYVNREGFYLFNLFMSPVERTLRVKKFKGEIAKSSVVRLVPDHSRNKVVAEYEGSGAKGVPLSAIVAYAALEGVYDTGEYSLVVEYRARDIATLSGLGVGSGAAAAVSSADSARAGSVSVGAIVGYSEAYTKYVYDIRVKVVRASAEALAAARCLATEPPPPVKVEPPPRVVIEPPPPPVKVEPPPPQPPPACDESIYRIRIAALLEGCKNCPKDCLNNELLRKQLGDAYLQWFNCTGRTNMELLRKAIEQYKKAEINFLQGVEPNGKKTRNLTGAQDIVYKARYNWAWSVYMLDGYEAEMVFAKAKGLKSAPECYEELKF